MPVTPPQPPLAGKRPPGEARARRKTAREKARAAAAVQARDERGTQGTALTMQGAVDLAEIRPQPEQLRKAAAARRRPRASLGLPERPSRLVVTRDNEQFPEGFEPARLRSRRRRKARAWCSICLVYACKLHLGGTAKPRGRQNPLPGARAASSATRKEM